MVLYYVAQWLTFLLGFGALETIVVYPAILLLYALLFARHCWKYVVPMLLASGGLVYLQIAGAPLAREGVYRPDFGAGALLGTLHGYAQWTFGGVDSQWIGPVLVAAAAAVGVRFQTTEESSRLRLTDVKELASLIPDRVDAWGLRHRFDRPITEPMQSTGLQFVHAIRHDWRCGGGRNAPSISTRPMNAV